MKRALPVLALAALASLPSPASAAGHPILPTAQMAIENLVKSYAESWEDGRPRNVMKHFLEDAVLIPHHGTVPLEGTDAIYDFWWPRGGTDFGVTSYEITPTDVYGEGELAYVIARFKLEYWMGEKEERKVYRNEGNWLGIFSRDRKDRWRIIRLMWNDPLEQVEVMDQ